MARRMIKRKVPHRSQDFKFFYLKNTTIFYHSAQTLLLSNVLPKPCRAFELHEMQAQLDRVTQKYLRVVRVRVPTPGIR